jgi:hypothetical protein
MNGKKTYLVALGGVLGAAAGFLTGTLDAPQAIQLAITSVLGATLRAGITSATTPKA